MEYEHNTTTFSRKELTAIFAKVTHVPENIPYLNQWYRSVMVSTDRYRERCPDGTVVGDNAVTSGPQHYRQPR